MKTKIFASIIFIIFMLLVINGFSDFVIFTKSRMHAKVNETAFLESLPSNLDRNTFKQYYKETKELSSYYFPTVGKLLKPTATGIYTIDKMGKRVLENTTSPPPQYKGNILLLGASQSFGYYLPAEKSLAGQLQALLPDIEIDNFSTPAQTTAENLQNWIRINQRQQKTYDLAIVVSGPMDIVIECFREMTLSDVKNETTRGREIAITTFYLEVSRFIKKEKNRTHSACTKKLEQHLIIDSIEKNFSDILAYGNDIGTTTIVVLPPTIWGNKANISNLKTEKHPLTEALNSIILSTRDQLSRHESIYDASDVFDDLPDQYFLDTWSHMTEQGNKLLALKIKSIIEQKGLLEAN